MKKLIATLLLGLALCCAQPALAYNETLAKLATEMNKGADGETVKSIVYDGQNIIATFGNSVLSADEAEMLQDLSSEDAKPLLLAGMKKGGMDAEFCNLFGSLLELDNANFVVNIPLLGGKTCQVVLTPQDLQNVKD